MSNTELHIGKLIPVKKISESETSTEVIIRLIGDVELEEKEEDLLSQLNDGDDKYYLFDGTLYEAEDEELDASDSFCEISKNEDGTLNYVTSFYNGGTYLQEMIQEQLDKL